MSDLNADLRAQLQRAAARPSAAPVAPPLPAPATRTAEDARAEELRRRAAELQARSFAQALFFFGSFGAASAALRSRAPQAANNLLFTTTGFEFRQTADALRAAGGSPSRAVRPTAFALLLAAPTPFGVVPPELYGLRPDYLDVRLVPEVLQFETLNTAADADRLAAFLAINARAAFEAELVALGRLSLAQLRERIAQIEALPTEARLIGAPLQTYYATAVETLRRRERFAPAVDSVPNGTPIAPALFVSREQAARIEAGELLPVPVAPLRRPQLPGALPVALQSAAALPPGQQLATAAPSLFPELEGRIDAVLPALYPSLLRPTTTASAATEANLLEGQREHFTEVADP